MHLRELNTDILTASLLKMSEKHHGVGGSPSVSPCGGASLPSDLLIPPAPSLAHAGGVPGGTIAGWE